MTAKISYDGRQGTTSTIRETQIVEDTAEKIDNFNVPFTAWVEKSTDTGAMEQFQQNGTWKGVNTLNFHKIFCTENLDTGHSNCPVEWGTELQREWLVQEVCQEKRTSKKMFAFFFFRLPLLI